MAARRFPPPWSVEVTPNSINSMPATMPATCDDGDNDARDQQNDDDSRYIFHNALRAGNIGPIGKQLAAWSVKLPELLHGIG